MHYLANHPLTDDVRKQLTEVVHGLHRPLREVAARAGIVWMRERVAGKGKRRNSEIERAAHQTIGPLGNNAWTEAPFLTADHREGCRVCAPYSGTLIAFNAFD
jgi:hypothetical protein